MRKLIAFALLLFLVVSCGNNETVYEFPSIWRLVSAEKKKGAKAEKDPLLADAKNHEAGQKGMLLCLFPDNTFTRLDETGYYDFGKWEWVDEGGRVNLTGQQKSTDWDVTIKKQEDDQFELTLENDQEKQVWQRQAKMLKKFEEDEFYPTNNTWRIKPKKAETQKEIIARLGNYLRHTTYLLKAADIRDVQVVSFSHSDGVVKIYNSGIGVRDWEYISDLWKNSYYNEEQAKLARLIYKNYLHNYPYNGTGSSDWVKDDYFLMLHIYNDLNEGKFDEPIANEILTEE